MLTKTITLLPLLLLPTTLSLALPSFLISRQSSYTPGWCGVHINQYQKNEPDTHYTTYVYDVSIADGAGSAVGGQQKVAIGDGASYGFTSRLPAVLILTSGSVDADSLQLAYNGASFGTNARDHCSEGQYDHGKREIDCGFTC